MDIIKNTEKYSEENYIKFYKDTGYKLDENYLEFLREYNGGDAQEGVFYYNEDDDDDGVMIDYFFGFCKDYYKDIIKAYEFMLDELPRGMLTIAYTVGGDYVCISTNEEDFGYIYLWDHEGSTDEYDTLILLTKDFTKLISELRKCK